MKPLASVLLLTYNHQKYIGQAIESVLHQKTDFDFEILIGDDCSVDGTAEIVKQFAEAHPDKIKIVSSPANVGALRNEKRLFEDAQGKYIAFLEGDDYWTDDAKLQKQVNFLEAHRDYGLVHGDVNLYYEENGVLQKSINKTEESQLHDDYSFEGLLTSEKHSIKTMTACFRKEIVTAAFSYDLAIEKNWKLTDLPLWLVLAKHSKIHYMDEVFATYRLLGESASQTSNHRKKHSFHQSVFDIRYYYWEKYSGEERVKNKLNVMYGKTLLTDAFILSDAAMARKAKAVLFKGNYRLTRKETILLRSTLYKVTRAVKAIRSVRGKK